MWCRQLEVITQAEGAGRVCRGENIHLASAQQRSCWPAGNQVPLTGTGNVIQAMAAGGSVTPRRGLKIQTVASVTSLSMLPFEALQSVT